MRCLSTFYQKYYADKQGRHFIFGINPGRFGAGLTGVPFTDPLRLETECGIENKLPKSGALFPDFCLAIYSWLWWNSDFCPIFLHHFAIALGLCAQWREYPRLLRRPATCPQRRAVYCVEPADATAISPLEIRPFASVKARIMPILKKLNEREGFFREIIRPHPRWIMQYRRKRVEEFVERYVGVLQSLCAAV